MSDEMSLKDCFEKVERALQKLHKTRWLRVARELEDRLLKLKREAIAEGEMKRAGELSVCEAMATVIKHVVEEGKKDEI